jgi:prepilin-type processing-associated H-X9-DG protein
VRLCPSGQHGDWGAPGVGILEDGGGCQYVGFPSIPDESHNYVGFVLDLCDADDPTTAHPFDGSVGVPAQLAGFSTQTAAALYSTGSANNNAAASNMAQSELAVAWDVISSDSSDYSPFNHIRGGCNVLYVDGHVAFIKYPSDRFPVTSGYALF